MRNDQVTRILRVITLLETHPQGLSIRELHKRLADEGVKCSLRSVYRDLEAVERAYLPVTKQGAGDESRWRLDSIASISPSIQISYREMLGLFIVRGTLDSMRGSPVHDAIQSFFARLEKAFGPRIQEGLGELESYLGFKSRPTWQSGVSQAVMDTVHQACVEGHELEIEYRSVSGAHRGEVKARRVGPEKILFADSGAYLIAKDLASGEFKMYSLARIMAASLCEESYEGHGDVTHELMRDGIGVFSAGSVEEVVIEVSEPMASYVSERRWHDSQVITRGQGGVTLKMCVKVNDELVRWVLGLGWECAGAERGEVDVESKLL